MAWEWRQPLSTLVARLQFSPGSQGQGGTAAEHPVDRKRGPSVVARSSDLLDDLIRDIHYAARTLLKTPGFALGVLSLAFAIGATAAVYSTVDWLINRSPVGCSRQISAIRHARYR